MENNNEKKNILEVEDLSVNYETGTSIFRAVKGISFSVKEGETISIVGESGSGKSTTAAALIGLLPHATGNVKLKGYTIPAAPSFIKKGFNQWMASQMQFIFQDPFTSLNPKARVQRILKEPFRTNNPFKEERKEAFYTLLKDINLLLIKSLKIVNSEKEKELLDFAHKLSNDRSELIHDAKHAIDLDIYKIKNYKAEIWQAKKEAKTKLARFAELRLQKQMQADKEDLDELLRVDNEEYNAFKTEVNSIRDEKIKELKKERQVAKAELKEAKQERKEVQARLKKERKEFEEMLADLKTSDNQKDINWDLRRRTTRKENGRWVRTEKGSPLKRIFDGSIADSIEFNWVKNNINPVYKHNREVKVQMENLVNDFFDKYERSKVKDNVLRQIQDKLVEVGLNREDVFKYPKDFSGGQRQRIAIARAIMIEPSIVIADEPISSLDVSIQAQIINLLKDLKQNHNLTLVFIAHDLRMVEYISNYIAVMSKGQVVEYGTAKEIFENPTHPYTRSLLSSIPSIDTINLRLKVLHYDATKYQDEELDLEEIHLSETHRVLGLKKWIKSWKKEAKDFVVYENQARHKTTTSPKKK